MTFWWSTLNFTLSIVFMGNFLYLALLHQRKVFELGDDVERCVAKDEINHPITVTNDTDKELVTDVGHQFY